MYTTGFASLHTANASTRDKKTAAATSAEKGRASAAEHKAGVSSHDGDGTTLSTRTDKTCAAKDVIAQSKRDESDTRMTRQNERSGAGAYPKLFSSVSTTRPGSASGSHRGTNATTSTAVASGPGVAHSTTTNTLMNATQNFASALTNEKASLPFPSTHAAQVEPIDPCACRSDVFDAWITAWVLTIPPPTTRNSGETSGGGGRASVTLESSPKTRGRRDQDRKLFLQRETALHTAYDRLQDAADALERDFFQVCHRRAILSAYYEVVEEDGVMGPSEYHRAAREARREKPLERYETRRVDTQARLETVYFVMRRLEQLEGVLGGSAAAARHETGGDDSEADDDDDEEEEEGIADSEVPGETRAERKQRRRQERRRQLQDLLHDASAVPLDAGRGGDAETLVDARELFQTGADVGAPASGNSSSAMANAFTECHQRRLTPSERKRRRLEATLAQRVRALKSQLTLPCQPSEVVSRVRNELLLGFSARVLALRTSRRQQQSRLGPAAGGGLSSAASTASRLHPGESDMSLNSSECQIENFVEWYVKEVIDPFALSQLLQIVPAEYMVTTTTRLVYGSDANGALRASRALPDLTHVMLRAIAEGRLDAFAQLVTSPSVSYLQGTQEVLSQMVLLYAALFGGQLEVLEQLVGHGFYHPQALIGLLFMHSNWDEEDVPTARWRPAAEKGLSATRSDSQVSMGAGRSSGILGEHRGSSAGRSSAPVTSSSLTKGMRGVNAASEFRHHLFGLVTEAFSDEGMQRRRHEAHYRRRHPNSVSAKAANGVDVLTDMEKVFDGSDRLAAKDLLRSLGQALLLEDDAGGSSRVKAVKGQKDAQEAQHEDEDNEDSDDDNEDENGNALGRARARSHAQSSRGPGEVGHGKSLLSWSTDSDNALFASHSLQHIRLLLRMVRRAWIEVDQLAQRRLDSLLAGFAGSKTGLMALSPQHDARVQSGDAATAVVAAAEAPFGQGGNVPVRAAPPPLLGSLKLYYGPQFSDAVLQHQPSGLFSPATATAASPGAAALAGVLAGHSPARTCSSDRVQEELDRATSDPNTLVWLLESRKLDAVSMASLDCRMTPAFSTPMLLRVDAWSYRPLRETLHNPLWVCADVPMECVPPPLHLYMTDDAVEELEEIWARRFASLFGGSRGQGNRAGAAMSEVEGGLGDATVRASSLFAAQSDRQQFLLEMRQFQRQRRLRAIARGQLSAQQQKQRASSVGPLTTRASTVSQNADPASTAVSAAGADALSMFADISSSCFYYEVHVSLEYLLLAHRHNEVLLNEALVLEESLRAETASCASTPRAGPSRTGSSASPTLAVPNQLVMGWCSETYRGLANGRETRSAGALGQNALPAELLRGRDGDEDAEADARDTEEDEDTETVAAGAESNPLNSQHVESTQTRGADLRRSAAQGRPVGGGGGGTTQTEHSGRASPGVSGGISIDIIQVRDLPMHATVEEDDVNEAVRETLVEVQFRLLHHHHGTMTPLRCPPAHSSCSGNRAEVEEEGEEGDELVWKTVFSPNRRAAGPTTRALATTWYPAVETVTHDDRVEENGAAAAAAAADSFVASRNELRRNRDKGFAEGEASLTNEASPLKAVAASPTSARTRPSFFASSMNTTETTPPTPAFVHGLPPTTRTTTSATGPIGASSLFGAHALVVGFFVDIVAGTVRLTLNGEWVSAPLCQIHHIAQAAAASPLEATATPPAVALSTTPTTTNHDVGSAAVAKAASRAPLHKACVLYPAATVQASGSVIDCLDMDVDLSSGVTASTATSDAAAARAVFRFAFDEPNLVALKTALSALSRSMACGTGFASSTRLSSSSPPAPCRGEGLCEPSRLDTTYKFNRILQVLTTVRASQVSSFSGASVAKLTMTRGVSAAAEAAAASEERAQDRVLAADALLQRTLMQAQQLLNQPSRGGLLNSVMIAPLRVPRRSADAVRESLFVLTGSAASSASAAAGESGAGGEDGHRGAAMASVASAGSLRGPTFTILSSNDRLSPLCFAIAARRPAMAYGIATHVLTDFHNSSDVAVRHRKLALQGACALGYAKVLQVLLERMPVYEILESFGLRVQKEVRQQLRREHRLRNQRTTRAYLFAVAEGRDRHATVPLVGRDGDDEAGDDRGGARAHPQPVLSTANVSWMSLPLPPRHCYAGAHSHANLLESSDASLSSTNSRAAHTVKGTTTTTAAAAAPTTTTTQLQASHLYSTHRREYTPLHFSLLGGPHPECVSALLNYLYVHLSFRRRVGGGGTRGQSEQADSTAADVSHDGVTSVAGESSNIKSSSSGAAEATSKNETGEAVSCGTGHTAFAVRPTHAWLREAINVSTPSGESALLMAIRYGLEPIAERLLRLGAEASCMDRATTAYGLEIACSNRSNRIASILLDLDVYRQSLHMINHAGVATPLCWCALSNASELIVKLLARGASTALGIEGNSPLQLAVMFGNEAAAQALLSSCVSLTEISLANAAVKRTQGLTPSSTRGGLLTMSGTADKTVVDGILRLSTDGTAAAATTRRTGASPRLHEVATSSHVAALAQTLQRPVLDVDAADARTQFTALHIASEMGLVTVVQALLCRRASLTALTKVSFHTPLHLALIFGHEAVAMALLTYGKDQLRRGKVVIDIAVADKNGDTALHLACKTGCASAVDYILTQYSAVEVEKALAHHSAHSQQQVVSSDANLRRTPMSAGSTVASATVASAQAGAASTQPLLKATSVDILAENKSGKTPLLLAIQSGVTGVVELVLSAITELPRSEHGDDAFGGPLVDGTCLALHYALNNQMRDVVLLLLSDARFSVSPTFKNLFLTAYRSAAAANRDDNTPAQSPNDRTVERDDNGTSEEGTTHARSRSETRSATVIDVDAQLREQNAKGYLFHRATDRRTAEKLEALARRAPSPSSPRTGEATNDLENPARAASVKVLRSSVASRAPRSKSEATTTMARTTTTPTAQPRKKVATAAARRKDMASLHQRRRSSYIRGLLARSVSSAIPPMQAIHLLLHGFALPELYVMLDEVSEESVTIGIQTPAAMLYGEMLSGFLLEHHRIVIAPNRVVGFARDALAALNDAVADVYAASSPTGLQASPQKAGMRALVENADVTVGDVHQEDSAPPLLAASSPSSRAAAFRLQNRKACTVLPHWFSQKALVKTALAKAQSFCMEVFRLIRLYGVADNGLRVLEELETLVAGHRIDLERATSAGMAAPGLGKPLAHVHASSTNATFASHGADHDDDDGGAARQSVSHDEWVRKHKNALFTDAHFTSPMGYTALQLAASLGLGHVVEYLLNEFPNVSPLYVPRVALILDEGSVPERAVMSTMQSVLIGDVVDASSEAVELAVKVHDTAGFGERKWLYSPLRLAVQSGVPSAVTAITTTMQMRYTKYAEARALALEGRALPESHGAAPPAPGATRQLGPQALPNVRNNTQVHLSSTSSVHESGGSAPENSTFATPHDRSRRIVEVLPHTADAEEMASSSPSASSLAAAGLVAEAMARLVNHKEPTWVDALERTPLQELIASRLSASLAAAPAVLLRNVRAAAAAAAAANDACNATSDDLVDVSATPQHAANARSRRQRVAAASLAAVNSLTAPVRLSLTTSALLAEARVLLQNGARVAGLFDLSGRDAFLLAASLEGVVGSRLCQLLLTEDIHGVSLMRSALESGLSASGESRSLPHQHPQHRHDRDNEDSDSFFASSHSSSSAHSTHTTTAATTEKSSAFDGSTLSVLATLLSRRQGSRSRLVPPHCAGLEMLVAKPALLTAWRANGYGVWRLRETGASPVPDVSLFGTGTESQLGGFAAGQTFLSSYTVNRAETEGLGGSVRYDDDGAAEADEKERYHSGGGGGDGENRTAGGAFADLDMTFNEEDGSPLQSGMDTFRSFHEKLAHQSPREEAQGDAADEGGQASGVSSAEALFARWDCGGQSPSPCSQAHLYPRVGVHAVRLSPSDRAQLCFLVHRYFTFLLFSLAEHNPDFLAQTMLTRYPQLVTRALRHPASHDSLLTLLLKGAVRRLSPTQSMRDVMRKQLGLPRPHDTTAQRGLPPSERQRSFLIEAGAEPQMIPRSGSQTPTPLEPNLLVKGEMRGEGTNAPHTTATTRDDDTKTSEESAELSQPPQSSRLASARDPAAVPEVRHLIDLAMSLLQQYPALQDDVHTRCTMDAIGSLAFVGTGGSGDEVGLPGGSSIAQSHSQRGVSTRTFSDHNSHSRFRDQREGSEEAHDSQYGALHETALSLAAQIGYVPLITTIVCLPQWRNQQIQHDRQQQQQREGDMCMGDNTSVPHSPISPRWPDMEDSVIKPHGDGDDDDDGEDEEAEALRPDGSKVKDTAQGTAASETVSVSKCTSSPSLRVQSANTAALTTASHSHTRHDSVHSTTMPFERTQESRIHSAHPLPQRHHRGGGGVAMLLADIEQYASATYDLDDEQDTSRAPRLGALVDESTFKLQLSQNLEDPLIRSQLATGVYYDLDALPTIASILSALALQSDGKARRVDFIRYVFPNLHPLAALRVAVEYASAARHFLVPVDCKNAFWVAVLYAQFTDQLNPLTVTAKTWNLLLRHLLPTAPAVPIFLIQKRCPELEKSRARQRERQRQRRRNLEAIAQGASPTSSAPPPSQAAHKNQTKSQTSSKVPRIAVEKMAPTIGSPSLQLRGTTAAATTNNNNNSTTPFGGGASTTSNRTRGTRSGAGGGGKRAGDYAARVLSNWSSLRRRADIFLHLTNMTVAEAWISAKQTHLTAAVGAESAAAATAMTVTSGAQSGRPSLTNTLLIDVLELAVRYDNVPVFTALTQLQMPSAAPPENLAAILASMATSAERNVPSGAAATGHRKPSTGAGGGGGGGGKSNGGDVASSKASHQARFTLHKKVLQHLDNYATAVWVSCPTLAYAALASATHANAVLQRMNDALWAELLQERHLDFIAIAAGSRRVLDTLYWSPPAAARPYLSAWRYDRIDARTGLPEGMTFPVTATDEVVRSHAERGQDYLNQTMASLMTTAPTGGTATAPHSARASVTSAAAPSAPAVPAMRGADLMTTTTTTTTLAPGEMAATPTSLARQQEELRRQREQQARAEDELNFARSCMRVGTAIFGATSARQETARVTWGLASDARVVEMSVPRQSKTVRFVATDDAEKNADDKGVEEQQRRRTGSSDNNDATARGRSSSAQAAGSLRARSASGGKDIPKAKSGSLETGGRTTRQRTSLKSTRGAPDHTAPSEADVMDTTAAPEPAQWFMYLQNDWVMHTALSLHSPHPSRSSMRVLALLMNLRVPLSVSVVDFFLSAAARDGSLLRPPSPSPLVQATDLGNRVVAPLTAAPTLWFASGEHHDTLLHLLVINDQCELAEYYLAAALYLFSHSQLDEPTLQPGRFTIREKQAESKGHGRGDGSSSGVCAKSNTTGKNGGEGEDDEEDQEDAQEADSEKHLPVSFLRLMLQQNRHGLTAFDYARSASLVQLLQQYGCVPPTYRPNPLTFQRALRTPPQSQHTHDASSSAAMSISLPHQTSFFPVPRLLLASDGFLSLQDSVQNSESIHAAAGLRSKSRAVRRQYERAKLALFSMISANTTVTPEGKAVDRSGMPFTGSTASARMAPVPDVALLRQLLQTQKQTQKSVLPILLDSQISLLHLGLCAADDELVIAHQQQLEKTRAAAAAAQTTASVTIKALGEEEELDDLGDTMSGGEHLGKSGSKRLPRYTASLLPPQLQPAGRAGKTSAKHPLASSSSAAAASSSGAEKSQLNSTGTPSQLTASAPGKATPSTATTAVRTNTHPLTQRDVMEMLERRQFVVFPLYLPPPPPPPTEEEKKLQQWRLSRDKAKQQGQKQQQPPQQQQPSRGIGSASSTRASSATTAAASPTASVASGGGAGGAGGSSAFLRKAMAAHNADAEATAVESFQPNEAAMLIALTPMQLAQGLGHVSRTATQALASSAHPNPQFSSKTIRLPNPGTAKRGAGGGDAGANTAAAAAAAIASGALLGNGLAVITVPVSSPAPFTMPSEDDVIECERPLSLSTTVTTSVTAAAGAAGASSVSPVRVGLAAKAAWQLDNWVRVMRQKREKRAHAKQASTSARTAAAAAGAKSTAGGSQSGRKRVVVAEVGEDDAARDDAESVNGDDDAKAPLLVESIAPEGGVATVEQQVLMKALLRYFASSSMTAQLSKSLGFTIAPNYDVAAAGDAVAAVRMLKANATRFSENL